MKYIHILTAAFLLVLAGCVKQEFDEPPLGGEPVDLTANATIAQVKALHTQGNIESITEDWIIEGEVIMDDRSGNYYKSLVIQDATGGIEVSFNDGFLYTEYPVGRKIFIKVKDLMLSDYNGLTQLIGSTLVDGTTIDEIGITLAQRKNVIFKGAIATDKLTPTVKSVSNFFQAADYSTLVRFENVEFFNPNQTYADPIAKLTRNRLIQDCDGNQVILRTSGYSDFAGVELAQGQGSITGVLSVFGTTPQLYIRNLDDVQMDDTRCDGGGGGTGTAELIDISDLRGQYNGTATTAPADKKISGIVVSDLAGANINAQNMVIQDGTAGILVRFSEPHLFLMGDRVEVNVSSMELSDFNGLLQVNEVPLSRAKKDGTGTATIRTATVSEIAANAEAWESTVVKIVGAELSGSTFGGGVTVDDGTGSISIYTANQAVFSGDAVPMGTVDVTAIVGDFNGVQLNMRNRSDVTGGTTGTGGGGDPVESINQDFQSQSDDVAVNLTDWTNAATVGTRTWLAKEFSGNVYAQATSYSSSDPAEEMWLITPPIILASQKTLNFESAQAFHNHDGLTVWVSTDFDGTNISAATWEPLSANLAGASTPNYEFVASGDIALPIAAQGYIGFKYNGNGLSATTSYLLDNVIVE